MRFWLVLTGLLTSVWMCACEPGDTEESSYEAKLHNNLMVPYRKRGTAVRPLRNTTYGLKVMVYMGMRLINIEIDEARQLMRTSAWVRMSWYDEWLQWDPKDYGGLKGISLPHDQIWSPEIYLVNTHKTDTVSRQPYVQVNSSGYVFWTPHHEFISGCLLDAANFPFDRHTCVMWFQPLGQTTDRLHLQVYPKSPMDLSTMLDRESQFWEILDNSTALIKRPQEEGMILVFSNRPSLRFSLTVKRKHTFQAFMILIPCILLPILTITVFVLPPDRPDRLSLAMGLLGCCVILFLLVNDIVPPTPVSTATLSIYYGINMIMILVAVVLTTIVINLFKRSDDLQPVPNIFHKLCVDILGQALCVRIVQDSNHSNLQSDHCLEENRHHNCEYTQDDNSRDAVVMCSSNGANIASTATLVQTLNRCTKRLDQLLPPKPPNSVSNTQWKVVAAVLDRIFFILFLVCDVIVFVIFFPRP